MTCDRGSVRSAEFEVLQDGGLRGADLSDGLTIMCSQPREPEFASMGHVWGDFGEYFWARHAYDVEKEWHISRANQRLGYPRRTRGNSHDPSPQGRVIERDLSPTLAHVRDSNPAQFPHAGPWRLHERVEAEYSREELWWQRGDRREGIATRKQRMSEIYGCIYFLIDHGNGCGTRCGCLGHGPDLVQSDFEEVD